MGRGCLRGWGHAQQGACRSLDGGSPRRAPQAFAGDTPARRVLRGRCGTEMISRRCVGRPRPACMRSQQDDHPDHHRSSEVPPPEPHPAEEVAYELASSWRAPQVSDGRGLLRELRGRLARGSSIQKPKRGSPTTKCRRRCALRQVAGARTALAPLRHRALARNHTRRNAMQPWPCAQAITGPHWQPGYQAPREAAEEAVNK